MMRSGRGSALTSAARRPGRNSGARSANCATSNRVIILREHDRVRARVCPSTDICEVGPKFHETRPAFDHDEIEWLAVEHVLWPLRGEERVTLQRIKLQPWFADMKRPIDAQVRSHPDCARTRQCQEIKTP